MTRDELLQRICDLLGRKLYLNTERYLYRAHVEWHDPKYGFMCEDGDSINFLSAAWPEDLDITVVRHRRDGETWRWNAWCTKLNIGIDTPHPHSEWESRAIVLVAVLEHERGAGGGK